LLFFFFFFFAIDYAISYAISFFFAITPASRHAHIESLPLFSFSVFIFASILPFTFHYAF